MTMVKERYDIRDVVEILYVPPVATAVGARHQHNYHCSHHRRRRHRHRHSSRVSSKSFHIPFH